MTLKFLQSDEKEYMIDIPTNPAYMYKIRVTPNGANYFRVGITRSDDNPLGYFKCNDKYHKLDREFYVGKNPDDLFESLWDSGCDYSFNHEEVNGLMKIDELLIYCLSYCHFIGF